MNTSNPTKQELYDLLGAIHHDIRIRHRGLVLEMCFDFWETLDELVKKHDAYVKLDDIPYY